MSMRPDQPKTDAAAIKPPVVASPPAPLAPVKTPLELLTDRVSALELLAGVTKPDPIPYPKMLYHPDEDPRTVNSVAEEKLLLSMGWSPTHVQVTNDWDHTTKLRAAPPPPAPLPPAAIAAPVPVVPHPLVPPVAAPAAESHPLDR
jgi:hypothetical protein